MTKQTIKQTSHDITTNLSLSDTANDNLCLFVHRNGNTDLSLHDIKKVVIGKNRNIVGKNGVFVVRKITLQHDNNTTTEINLFIK